jgi:hypothetical protein
MAMTATMPEDPEPRYCRKCGHELCARGTKTVYNAYTGTPMYFDTLECLRVDYPRFDSDRGHDMWRKEDDGWTVEESR